MKTAVICFLLFGLFVSAYSDRNLQVKIDPNKGYVVRYVGDSAKLTCSISKGNFSYVKENQFETDEKDKYALNWMIPTNAHERVVSKEGKEHFEITINDLKESDSGNYRCHLIKKEDNRSVSNYSTIHLAVLPKARVSYCDKYSFYCERTLCIPIRYKCDGVPDCPNNKDESEETCGKDTCINKLSCEDGRCLAPEFCCRKFGESPPNCVLHANVQCCRQIIHPAIVDQDMYYMASKHNIEEASFFKSLTSVAMGIGTPVILLTVLAFLWTWRFKNSRTPPPPEITVPDNYVRSRVVLTFGGLPESARQYCVRPGRALSTRSELILEPIPIEEHDVSLLSSESENNSYSELSDPPPTYLQVVGAPPPYSSAEDISGTAESPPDYTGDPRESVSSEINSPVTNDVIDK